RSVREWVARLEPETANHFRSAHRLCIIRPVALPLFPLPAEFVLPWQIIAFRVDSFPDATGNVDGEVFPVVIDAANPPPAREANLTRSPVQFDVDDRMVIVQTYYGMRRFVNGEIHQRRPRQFQ